MIINPLFRSSNKISKFPRSANKLAITRKSAREQTTTTSERMLRRKDSGRINGRVGIILNKLENIRSAPRHGTKDRGGETTAKNANRARQQLQPARRERGDPKRRANIVPGADPRIGRANTARTGGENPVQFAASLARQGVAFHESPHVKLANLDVFTSDSS